MTFNTQRPGAIVIEIVVSATWEAILWLAFWFAPWGLFALLIGFLSFSAAYDFAQSQEWTKFWVSLALGLFCAISFVASFMHKRKSMAVSSEE